MTTGRISPARARVRRSFPTRQRVSKLPRSGGVAPWVGIIMGSKSDFEVLSVARDLLVELEIPCEVRVVSAHRTPDQMFQYAEAAEERGLMAIIAGAGGAAHLPGMVAAKTLVPVLGVPVPATALAGMDALLSIVQMPRGVPVGTLAIGKPGAANAAILAAQIVALTHPEVRERLRKMRERGRQEALSQVVG
jgi:5-(carboxyamino)imidazole ribonucleotide mutase